MSLLKEALGKCFPKDLVAIMGEFKNAGVDVSLLETMWKYNKKIRKVHDWEEIPFAVGSTPKSKIRGILPD